MKNCRLYDVLMDLQNTFIKYPHIFLNDNIRELWTDLDETDQKIFPFDMRSISWDSYLKVYYDGILKYLIKETDREEGNAHKHYLKYVLIGDFPVNIRFVLRLVIFSRLQTLHGVVKAFLYSMAGFLVYLVFYIFW